MQAVLEMKKHRLFPQFCERVGAPPEKWGTAEGDAVQEHEIFMEWLAAAEQDCNLI